MAAAATAEVKQKKIYLTKDGKVIDSDGATVEGLDGQYEAQSGEFSVNRVFTGDMMKRYIALGTNVKFQIGGVCGVVSSSSTVEHEIEQLEGIGFDGVLYKLFFTPKTSTEFKQQTKS